MKESYKNPYGTWEVKTVNGEDGSVVKHLGAYIGYVDEIALHLADKCGHYLEFKRIEAKELRPTGADVTVSFNYESGLFEKGGMPSNLPELSNSFSKRPVNIHGASGYRRFMIESKSKDSFIKEEALKKLTDEERRVLGL